MANRMATALKVNGENVHLPSHISIVSGLDGYVKGKIDALSSVYLGKTEKAESATTADSATTATSATSATKATQDGQGRVIATTYYTTATTVAKATADAQGNTIHTTYLGKTAKAASATTADSATTATKATQDGNGKNIASTYISGITVNGTTLTYQTGSGTSTNRTLPYPSAATTTSAGLMSMADKIKLDGIEEYAQNFSGVDVTNNAAYNYDANTAYGDFNKLIEPGFYNVSLDKRQWANAPQSGKGSTVFVIVYNSHPHATYTTGRYFQHMFRYTDQSNEFPSWFRSGTKSAGWTGWYKFQTVSDGLWLPT